MWTFEPADGAGRWVASGAYLAAVLAFLLLQQLGLRLRRAEHRDWWAGSGRDLLNLAGLVCIAGSLRLLGLSAPAAVVVGGTVTLLLFGASVFVATQTSTAHPRAWALAAGLACALPVLAYPRELVAALAAVVGALFGAAAPR